jgi:peptidoglycan/xylan/chitin deacetylase (PgdA/CDA1 family)
MLLKHAFQIASPSGSSAALSILIFHRVLSIPDPLFPGEADCVMFDRVIGWITQWFNILPLEHAITLLRRSELPARAAAITFDDGYADNLLNAVPILKNHSATATFFIATGFLDGGRMWNDTVIESVRRAKCNQLDASFLGVGNLDITDPERKRNALARLIPAIKHLPGQERTKAVDLIAASCAASLPQDLMLTSAQLIKLRNMGMGIGAHTVNHPILTKMEANSALHEIANSRDFLQNLLGERISLFAYPNGHRDIDYNLEHTRIVQNLGFDAAVTTNPGVSRKNSDLYQLPRFTPWDRTRTRFGLRLLLNDRQSK